MATALLLGLTAESRRRGCRSMWTGAEKRNDPALATYAAAGATFDDTSVFVTWDDLGATVGEG